jgi:hypothetical protein
VWDQDQYEPTPWYRDRRLWLGVAVGIGIASAIYAAAILYFAAANPPALR